MVAALFLAVGALLVALDANPTTRWCSSSSTSPTLDLGVFRGDNGIKTSRADAATKNALVNWGLAAIAYLVVGRVLDGSSGP